MKAKEIRDRGSEELRLLLDQMGDDFYKARVEHQLDQLKQTHKLKSLKRDMARIQTILRERELAGSKG